MLNINANLASIWLNPIRSPLRIAVLLVSINLLAYFLAWEARVNHLFSYLLGLVFICSIGLWKECKQQFSNSGFHLLIIIAITYLTSRDISQPYNTDDLKSLRNAISLTAFVYIVALATSYNHKNIRRFSLCLVVGATVSALITSYLSLYDTVIEEIRHHSYGRLTNPVVAALSYGFAATLAFHYAQQSRKATTQYLYIGAFLVLYWVILLTGTRLVWLGLLGAVFSLYFVKLNNRTQKHIASVLVVSGTILFLAFQFLQPSDFPQDPAEEFIAAHSSKAQAAYGTQGSTRISHDEGVLTLDSYVKPYSAVAFPALKLTPGAYYQISVAVKTNEPAEKGFYLRLHLSDQQSFADKPQIITINASENQSEAMRQTTNLGENLPVFRNWKTYQFLFQAGESDLSGSIVLLNWDGLGNQPLFVKDLHLQEDQSSLAPIRYFLSHVPWLDRGLSGRDQIWRELLREVIQSNYIFGIGNFRENSQLFPTYLHGHSIFMSALSLGGLVGLVLVGMLCLTAAKLAYTQQSEAWPMLVFSLLVLGIDGGNLVSKMDLLWILLWYPIAVTLGYSSRKAKT